MPTPETNIPILHSRSQPDETWNLESSENSNDDEGDCNRSSEEHLFIASFRTANSKQKHKYSSSKRCRPHIHRGARRVLRLLICLLLMPLTLLILYLPLYSSIQLRQAELTDWGFNISRNIADYVLPQNDTTLLEPHDVCQQEKIFVMIVVWSGLKNFATRQTIRETWGNTTEFNYHMFAQLHEHLKGQYLEVSEERLQFYSEYLNLKQNESSIQNYTIPVRVVFLVGRSKGETYDDELLNMQIRNESEHYQDILQENCVDTYNNLTIKSVLALKWMTRHCLQHCAFFLKCDDDTFVNIPNLLHYLLGGTIPLYNYTIDLYDLRTSKVLAPANRLNKTRNYLAGYMFCTATPIADVNSRWYMPYYMYPGDVYPNYLSGGAYIMSVDVAPQIYKAALNTTIVYMEDIYITGLCAEKAALKRTHQPLFEYSGQRKMCSLKGTITQHQMDQRKLLKAYEFVTDLTKLCAPPSRFFKHMPLRIFGSCF